MQHVVNLLYFAT